MAWRTMLISGCVALVALVIGVYGLTVGGVIEMDLHKSLPYSQHVLRVPAQQDIDGEALKHDWDILYHQGGNSPWIPKIDGTVEGGIEVPEGCRVDQVHMMSRHAERYPTTLAGIHMLELYHRIQRANVTLKGDLAFVNDWDFFMQDPVSRLENLVSTGPYAGTLEAFGTGIKLRTRYEDLLARAIALNQTNSWASGSKRVEETAQYFAAGLYGLDWKDTARLNIIPETGDRGGNTLTAGKTCFKYLHSADGRSYGYRMWNEWRDNYLPPIVKRLAELNPEIAFSASEVYSMQELCGFETIAKGSSKWCDVFSHDEWEQFEYARDVLHYYRTGPGSPYSATMGWLWLNATANLLRRGPNAGPLFFSFVHDGDILPLISAHELIPLAPSHLPTTHMPTNRTWRTSDLVPMGGRIVFERLTCGEPQQCWNRAEYGYPNHIYCSPHEEKVYIRINVNDGIVALPGCEDGPGRSCALDEFLEKVRRRGEEVGEFREVCGLPKGAKGGIEFLHQ